MKFPFSCIFIPFLLVITLPGYSQENQRSNLDSTDFYDDDNSHWDRKRTRTKSRLHQFNINYAFYAGIKGSKFSVSGFNNNTFPGRWGPVAGGAIHLSLPSVSKYLVLLLEPNYADLNFTGTEEVQSRDEIQRKDYQFRLTTFQVPVTMRLNFKSEGNTFYLKAGYAFNWYNSGKLKWVNEVEAKREIITTIGTIDLEYENQGTLLFGTGYKHALFHTLYIYGECRYERAGNILNPSVFESGTFFQNLYFIIGIEF